MALKMRKDYELKMQENLYTNIFLLTLKYLTTEEFKKVFKRDMFAKNNKAAFHQVSYFLLYVLNPSVVKEKLPSWPLYDARGEIQFRNEVMRYINELNLIYEDANVPTLMMSHLVSPGGFKFIKFMFLLSEFVLLKHLQNIPTLHNTIAHLKPNKSSCTTSESIDNLKLICKKINGDNEEMKKKFNEYFDWAKEEGGKILEEIEDVKKDLAEINQKLAELKVEDPAILSDLQVDDISNKIVETEAVLNRCKKLKELMMYMFSDDVVLSHKKTDVAVSANVAHIVDLNVDSLDILKFFEGLKVLLDSMVVNRQIISSLYMNGNVKKYKGLADKLRALNNCFNEIYSEFSNLKYNSELSNGV